MSPATLSLIIGLVELAIKEAPTIRTDLQTILSKTDPTPADWFELKAKVLAESFESLAPDAPTE